MGGDYYATLELKPEATQADIKNAYRALATKWHPDSNDKTNSDVRAENFRRVNEAYCVLSDDKLRTIYDQYGERGLKEGVSNSKGGRLPAWTYSANPEQQYMDFFGTYSPFADFFSGGSGLNMPLFAKTEVPKAGDVAPQVHHLFCSLEELYGGCSKKFKVTRQKLEMDGKTTRPEDHIMTIEVQKGWREGTKITFTGEGDEQVGMNTGDVVFLLKEKPHPLFKRNKNDLVFTAKISLVEALTGTTVQVPTLDGRKISVPITEIVRPNVPVVVPGEGMPTAKGGKGDLRIEFDVQFPDMLTEDQKSSISAIL